jgi:hypothetical protein
MILYNVVKNVVVVRRKKATAKIIPCLSSKTCPTKGGFSG